MKAVYDENNNPWTYNTDGAYVHVPGSDFYNSSDIRALGEFLIESADAMVATSRQKRAGLNPGGFVRDGVEVIYTDARGGGYVVCVDLPGGSLLQGEAAHMHTLQDWWDIMNGIDPGGS